MRRMAKAVAAGLLCGLVVAGTGRGAFAAPAAVRVNINSASADELASLPGIGPAKAKAIIDHRSEQPFRTPDDLGKVKGIGDKLFERVKDQITVEPAAKGHGG